MLALIFFRCHVVLPHPPQTLTSEINGCGRKRGRGQTISGNAPNLSSRFSDSQTWQLCFHTHAHAHTVHQCICTCMCTEPHFRAWGLDKASVYCTHTHEHINLPSIQPYAFDLGH